MKAITGNTLFYAITADLARAHPDEASPVYLTRRSIRTVVQRAVQEEGVKKRKQDWGYKDNAKKTRNKKRKRW